MTKDSKAITLWILLLGPLFVTGGCTVIDSWLNESGTVARKEFSPSATLKKYEWFKDASAQLDKKKSDITVSEATIKNLENAYTGLKRSDWSSDDRAEHNQLTAELNGIKASFNQLAAEYNSGMAKVNYSFANLGKLPEGAEVPLPREYKSYIVQ